MAAAAAWHIHCDVDAFYAQACSISAAPQYIPVRSQVEAQRLGYDATKDPVVVVQVGRHLER